MGFDCGYNDLADNPPPKRDRGKSVEHKLTELLNEVAKLKARVTELEAYEVQRQNTQRREARYGKFTDDGKGRGRDGRF